MHKITSINQLRNIFEQLNSQSLVLWDINNVLLTYANPVVRSESFRQRLWGIKQGTTNKQKFWSRWIQFHATQPVQLVESATLEYIATLRQNNVGIGVLSSAPGDTVAEARRKQLQQKIGIPFDPCLFATHLDKGEVLHAFLKKITPGTYQHIVFIDDLAPNIALTAKMVAQHGITFTGIWYCADILASLPIPSEEEVESLAQEFWCAQQDSNLRPTD